MVFFEFHIIEKVFHRLILFIIGSVRCLDGTLDVVNVILAQLCRAVHDDTLVQVVLVNKRVSTVFNIFALMNHGVHTL